MNFASFLREDQRLVMLRFLSEMPSYSSNSSVIYQALTRYGHAPSRDQIKSELRWLEELVIVDDIDGASAYAVKTPKQFGCENSEKWS